MANHLTMALIDSVLTLHQRGWSKRRIARELGINRETVARYLHAALAEAKPANAPLGSTASPNQAKPANAPLGSTASSNEAKPANAPLGSTPVDPVDTQPLSAAPTLPLSGRVSECEPWRAVILSKLDLGLSAQRIFQDLRTEDNYQGSYYSIRRFVRRLEQKTELPFRRLECAPGEEAQVDFGTGAPIVVEGKRRRTYVFRIVLSHSRKGYSEAVLRQTTDDFLCCIENAFWSFGGVPRTLVLDNLKAAVTKADWFDPELNPRVGAFAAHCGVAFLPTKPYTPRHKGKIERGVGYVQDNGLKGRQFQSLGGENTFLLEWEATVADTRMHGTIRQQVGKLFSEVERPALLPLPAERFPYFHEGRRTVHRDGHVEVDKAYYSAPPEYVSRRVWVRWDGRMVRIFNDRMEQLTVHVRREPGRFSTHQEHIATEKIAGVERGAVWLLGQIRLLGVQAAAWAEAVIAHRGIEGLRVLQGLRSLAGRHGGSSIDQACGIALSYGAYRLKTVRGLIGREAPKQEPLPFIEEHPLIRPLTDYAELVHTSFQKER